MFVDVPPYDMVRVIQREVPRTQLEVCFTPLRSFASLAANIRVADRASRTYGIYDPECEDPLFNI